MPNYDYHCSNCGHTEVVFQKMSDQPLTECPSCHQPSFRRGPGGGIGLHFQGSGFYITDYDSTRKDDKSSPNGHTHTPSCGCGKPNSCSSNE